MLPGFAGLSYEERLRKLELPSLAYRRSRGERIEVYKILTGVYDPECTEGLFERRGGNNVNTRGHSMRIKKPPVARTTARSKSFVYRTVNPWNSLSEHVISANSVMAFERRLDKFWRNQEQKYDYKALISTTRSQEDNEERVPQA